MCSFLDADKLASFFDSEQFSDVAFVFDDSEHAGPGRRRVLRAHKVLLSVFSEHFASMFQGAWKESQ